MTTPNTRLSHGDGDYVMKKDCIWDDCVYCMQSLQDNPDPKLGKQYGVVFRIDCGHEFHAVCLSSWFDSWYVLPRKLGSPTCPVCRIVIKESVGCSVWALINECITCFEMLTSDAYTKGIQSNKVIEKQQNE